MTCLVLFTGLGFGGNSWTVPAGLVSIPDLSVYGFSDNVQSFFLEPPSSGYILLDVYTGTNYTGSTYRFRAPLIAGNLNQYGLANMIKSLKLTIDTTTNPPGVTLYQDRNQISKSQYFGVGSWPNLANQPIGADTVQSAVLFGMTEANLYTGTNYTGTNWNIGNSGTYLTYATLEDPNLTKSVIVAPY